MVDLVPDGKKLGWLIDQENMDWVDSLPKGTPFTYSSYKGMPPTVAKPSTWIKIEDQNGFGSCFPAGTKVTLANGDLKNIEDIELGDEVITHKGNSNRVINLMSRYFSGAMITVSVEEIGNVLMTDDHPVLVDSGEDFVWKAAKNLQPGMTVFIRNSEPYLNTKHGKPVKVLSISSNQVDRLKVYDFTVNFDHSFIANGLTVHNCQGNALSSCCEIAYWLASGGDIIQLSRWFAYIGTQKIDGIRGDQGSTIAGGAELARTRGICPEDLYPYPRRYTYSISNAQYEAAKDYKLSTFRRMQTVGDCRKWLDAGIGAISIGVRWGGGGHAICLCETDGSDFIYANSWGVSWGDKGFGRWTEREMRSLLRDNYTVAIGMTDMEKVKPRELNWDIFA